MKNSIQYFIIYFDEINLVNYWNFNKLLVIFYE